MCANFRRANILILIVLRLCQNSSKLSFYLLAQIDAYIFVSNAKRQPKNSYSAWRHRICPAVDDKLIDSFVVYHTQPKRNKTIKIFFQILLYKGAFKHFHLVFDECRDDYRHGWLRDLTVS